MTEGETHSARGCHLRSMGKPIRATCGPRGLDGRGSVSAGARDSLAWRRAPRPAKTALSSPATSHRGRPILGRGGSDRRVRTAHPTLRRPPARRRSGLWIADRPAPLAVCRSGRGVSGTRQAVRGRPWRSMGSHRSEPFKRTLSSRRQRECRAKTMGGSRGRSIDYRTAGRGARSLYPDLPIMVRPNGYLPVESSATPGNARRRKARGLAARPLRNASRAPTSASSGRLSAWPIPGYGSRVEFIQFGADWSGVLATLPDNVAVEYRTQEPWSRIVQTAGEFDAAVVVGFNRRNRWRLPSKSIQYLTLPIPRLAIAPIVRPRSFGTRKTNPAI